MAAIVATRNEILCDEQILVDCTKGMCVGWGGERLSKGLVLFLSLCKNKAQV